MRKTRKLFRDIITFNAEEEIYITLFVAKICSFAMGFGACYWMLA